MNPTKTLRRYESPLRAQRAAETKAALLGAATTLFTTKGWTSTGMRDVAKQAGVAVETLYSHFASKRRLLDAVMDHAVVGDDQPVAVADRPEFLALGQGTRARRIAAAASLAATVHVRTVAFARLLREAAAADGEVAEALQATRERQRLDVERAVELVVGRPPTTAERDGTWALVSPEVFMLLVEQSGWTPEQYEEWLAESLGRLLPRR